MKSSWEPNPDTPSPTNQTRKPLPEKYVNIHEVPDGQGKSWLEVI